MSDDDHASFDLAERLTEDRGGGASTIEVFAEVDQQALVFVQVHDLFQFGLQADSVDGFEDAEEDRVLPRLAVAFDDAVDVTQTLGVADVVADEEAAAQECVPLECGGSTPLWSAAEPLSVRPTLCFLSGRVNSSAGK